MPELTEGNMALKAAGDDGLPAGVEQVWLAVRESVRCLFQELLDARLVPRQWRDRKNSY